MDSLRSFLDDLAPDQIPRVSEPVSLDYKPTALVLELEKRRRFPVLFIERPEGGDVPVVANIFADRARIAGMVGVGRSGFNDAWVRAMEHRIPPVLVPDGPVHEVIETGEQVDAARLPISRHFTQDAGRHIGSGILVC